MAGVQIDGVNNKIDFDDDLDTSISANTDDTLVIEAGGNTMATITATTFTINDGTTITTADNTDTLTLISTDADATVGPNLNFYRNSGSPADNDDLGKIVFNGRNDNSQDVVYAQIRSTIVDASDGTEDGLVKHDVSLGGTAYQHLSMGNGSIVFNEESQDIDFRVESNGNTHMIFVDGGSDDVRIGTATTFGNNDAGLKVKGGITIGDFTADSAANNLMFVKSRNTTVGSQTIVADDDEIGRIAFKADDGNDTSYNNNVAAIFAQIDGTPGTNDTPGRLIFETTPDGARVGTEKMRIEEDGHVCIGSTTSSRMLAVTTPASYSQFTVDFNNASSSAPYGILNRYTGAAPDAGTDFSFLECVDTGANRLNIFSDGDVKNHDNSYGALSDERIKQNIRDSNSQWNDIKAVKVRNFKKKDDVRQYGDNAWEQIGVIAQELEAVSPKLIRKHNPTSHDILSNAEFGTLYEDGDDIPEDKAIGDVKEIKDQVKSVNYSILYMKAIKALQEAQTRIETLETKVAALEG